MAAPTRVFVSIDVRSTWLRGDGVGDTSTSPPPPLWLQHCADMGAAAVLLHAPGGADADADPDSDAAWERRIGVGTQLFTCDHAGMPPVFIRGTHAAALPHWKPMRLNGAHVHFDGTHVPPPQPHDIVLLAPTATYLADVPLTEIHALLATLPMVELPAAGAQDGTPIDAAVGVAASHTTDAAVLHTAADETPLAAFVPFAAHLPSTCVQRAHFAAPRVCGTDTLSASRVPVLDTTHHVVAMRCRTLSRALALRIHHAAAVAPSCAADTVPSLALASLRVVRYDVAMAAAATETTAPVTALSAADVAALVSWARLLEPVGKPRRRTPPPRLTPLGAPRRTRRVYLSLTTTPQRLPYVAYALAELDWTRVHEAILNLPDRGQNQTQYDAAHIAALTREFPRLRVHACGPDLGPATKLLPTLTAALPPLDETNAHDIVVTLDDDTPYPPWLLEALVDGVDAAAAAGFDRVAVSTRVAPLFQWGLAPCPLHSTLVDARQAASRCRAHLTLQASVAAHALAATGKSAPLPFGAPLPCARDLLVADLYGLVVADMVEGFGGVAYTRGAWDAPTVAWAHKLLRLGGDVARADDYVFNAALHLGGVPRLGRMDALFPQFKYGFGADALHKRTAGGNQDTYTSAAAAVHAALLNTRAC